MSEPSNDHYEHIAARYADSLEQRPWNVFYERPGTLSLLPDVRGKSVLDVGCGSGWYAEHLVSLGANVTAFDRNPDFVKLAQQRLGDRAGIFQADLSEPLTMLEDESFDVIVCPLVLHYLKDWRPPLRELHRVLKPDGRLIFSTHHPTMDWQLFQTENYFNIELLEDEWDIGKVTYYRRPLTKICEDLFNAGFLIERILEPEPLTEFKSVDPEGYQRLKTRPGFLFVRLVKQFLKSRSPCSDENR